MIKKRKHNGKYTETDCLHCRCVFMAHRNDAKYCSDLCRVQDGIERREKGYSQHVFSGTLEELKKFFYSFSHFLQGDPFKNHFQEIEQKLEKMNNCNSWKIEFKYYQLNYLSKNKKRPFEIYYNSERYRPMSGWKKLQQSKPNKFSPIQRK